MTATRIESVADQAQAQHDDDLHHIICCFDHNLALCGRDATEFTWSDEQDNSCATCSAAEQTDACPTFGQCIDPDFAPGP